MKKIFALLAVVSFLAASLSPAMAEDQTELHGQIAPPQPSSPYQPEGLLELRPTSNLEAPEDIGGYAHTSLRVLVSPSGESIRPFSHEEAKNNFRNGFSPEASTATNVANSPSSLACVYQLVAQPAGQAAGCNPANTTANPSGGGGAIAIVDAYDYPTAAQDLATFSNVFGVPAANFQVVYAGGSAPYISGSQPPNGTASGWTLEEALDIEWAHAMAPGAKIYLVEAQSNAYTDLVTAIVAAQYLVSQAGGGEISMSWGGSEFSAETAYDFYFSSSFSPSNITYFASSGDTGSNVLWPSASPYVVSVGGTSINRNANNAFVSETTWSSGGGGISQYETQPAFQAGMTVGQSCTETYTEHGRTYTKAIAGCTLHRTTPDLSLDANPTSGVWVNLAGSWEQVGGTSVAAPTTAGIFNVADHAAGSFPYSSNRLESIYSDQSKATQYRDITSGNCGTDISTVGYDLCTGWGSSLTYSGK